MQKPRFLELEFRARLLSCCRRFADRSVRAWFPPLRLRSGQALAQRARKNGAATVVVVLEKDKSPALWNWNSEQGFVLLWVFAPKARLPGRPVLVHSVHAAATAVAAALRSI